MNDLDTRIQQALRAQAEQLTEQDLTPMLPPRRADSQPSWRLPILAAAAVVLVAVGGTVAIRAATEDASRTPAPGATQPAPSSAAPSISTAPTQSNGMTTPPAPASSSPLLRPTLPPPSTLPAGYEPLWPIDASGNGQPAGDAPATALAFTRQYLGFTEITMVTSSRYDDRGAHIGVGYRNPNGKPMTAAVLHLLQYSGNGPWEVVGSDDTLLSLEQPAYGSAVSSPMTAGGHITGVDDCIHVAVRSQAAGVVGRASCAPAGGQASPWYNTVSFTGSGVLTVVAWTGGHLQEVEIFAIQGVHT
jgi:hypothetical protein